MDIIDKLLPYSRYEKEVLQRYLRQLKDTVTEDELANNFSKYLPHLTIESGFPVRLLENSFIPKKYVKGFEFKKHGRFTKMESHRHEHIEMSYVLSGSINETIDNRTITLKKGDLIILDTVTSHELSIADMNDILINIAINTNEFNSLFFEQMNSIEEGNIVNSFLVNSIYQRQKYDGFLIFHTNEYRHIRLIMESLIYEFLDNPLGSTVVIENYMTILFVELIRLCSYELQVQTDEYKQSKIHDIKKYIEENLDTINLSTMSSHFGYHTSYYSKYLKNKTGKTFSKIILEERLKKASFLLKNTSHSVETICTIIGIRNLTFFYQKFKYFYGCSPKEYRKKV